MNILRYANIRLVAWNRDLTFALFVFVAGFGCFTHCDADVTTPHVCIKLDIDRRAATLSLENPASGHVSRHYLDLC